MERVRAGLRIPMDLNTKLILLAKRRGISKNALMLEFLWLCAEEMEAAGAGRA